MDSAKDAVSGFLHHNNKHSVDIEQTTAPAVTHERVQEAKHENITTALDREVHQHHHQTHVQPIQDKVVEQTQHHTNVLPVEHRQHHHGKDREVELALKEQASQFRDEREVLPTQVSQSTNTLVGEHVHHHIHDTIQPVIERERLQQHVVHTTVPIHERIDKEPVIHSGNVLPTKTLAEFQSAGHSLVGGKSTVEHIDYEGEPLKIKDDSRVGFEHGHRHIGAGTTGAPGELGTTTGAIGAAGVAGAAVAGHHHHHHNTEGPHNSNIENKLDPRVDSDGDGKSGLGRTGTGSNYTIPGQSGGMTGSSVSNATSGLEQSGTRSSEYGVGNSGSTGLGSGNTGVSESAGSYDNTAEKPSTTDKLLSKIGLGSK